NPIDAVIGPDPEGPVASLEQAVQTEGIDSEPKLPAPEPLGRPLTGTTGESGRRLADRGVRADPVGSVAGLDDVADNRAGQAVPLVVIDEFIPVVAAQTIAGANPEIPMRVHEEGVDPITGETVGDGEAAHGQALGPYLRTGDDDEQEDPQRAP